jgi:ParB/RepB/Spo0J family partition protein
MKQIGIDSLHAHPDNPRLFLRENVVQAIAEQIKDGGQFEERHAPHVRKTASNDYQIISGHQRIEAARRAGMETVPCCVVEMNEEETLREVLLSNAQSDLSPLEIGIHVLKVAGKGKAGRGNKNGIAEYARKMGVGERTLQEWACAAQVANKSRAQVRDLLDYTKSLSILHRTREEDWPDLVARMLAGNWTKEQTERYVDVLKTLEMPAGLAAIFPRPILIARYFENHGFS